jgi:hypothetical protein
MALSQRLVVSGLSAPQATAIQGTVANGLTALGTTQANALALPADVNYFTTVGAGTGTVLPAMNPGDSVNLYNKGAAALLVYPPPGAVINSLGANAGYSVATATPYVEVYCVTPLIYIASQSA